jgi:hypothetical protein
MFGSPLVPRGKKGGERVFRAVRNRRRRQPRHDAALQIERAITITRRDGLKSRTAEREGTVSRRIRLFAACAYPRRRHRARPTKKRISISYVTWRISSPRDSFLECHFGEVNSRGYPRYKDIKMETHAKSIFHILEI